MTAAYRLYTPQGVPVAVAPGIWTVEGGIVPFSLGPVQVPCPTRMTVVRNDAGELAVHSPTQLTQPLMEQLHELGTVALLIAPNSFHFVNLSDWADAYPAADVLVAPHMPRRMIVPTRARRIEFGSPSPLHGVLDFIVVDAGAWAEVAFFHRPSRSLILTDLVQNFEIERVSGRLAKTLLGIGGATGNPPRASIEMRLAAALRLRRARIAKSFRAIRAWQPERVLISHGAQPAGSADQILEAAFAWA